MNKSIDKYLLNKLNKKIPNSENYNYNNIRILNNQILDSNLNPEYKNLTELCLNQGKIIFHLVGDVQNLNNQIEKKNNHIKELNNQLDNYKNNKFNSLNK